MKTYGHLRREHSIAQAQKVSFAPNAINKADVIPFSATAILDCNEPVRAH